MGYTLPPKRSVSERIFDKAITRVKPQDVRNLDAACQTLSTSEDEDQF
jgi:hypothetical protein